MPPLGSCGLNLSVPTLSNASVTSAAWPSRHFPKGRKLVALLGGLGLLGGIAYAFLAPQWYSAQLTVVPSTTPKGGGMGASGLAAMASIDPTFDLLAGGSDAERIAAVFRSASVTDAAIAKFNLIARYKASYPEEARKEFWDHCSPSVDKKPGIVSVICEDRSPEIAKSLVEFLGEESNRVLRRVTTSSAGEERRFLEKRVELARSAMDDASKKLRQFQEENGIVSLPEQAKAIVSSIASLRADLLSKQMQLSYVSAFSSPDEASADQLRRQIGVLEAKVKALEASSPTPTSASAAPTHAVTAPRPGVRKDALFPPAMDVPRLQSQLEELYREQKMQETLFTLLVQRYEMARVQEVRDTSTFQVLDSPTLPRKRSRPKRALAIVLGLLAGVGVGLIRVTAPRWWPPMPTSTKP